MKEIGLFAGIDYENTTKMTIEEIIIALFRTMEIGENIKIIIKTNIGIKISMIVIDPMIQIILMAEIEHMTETDHTIGIGHIVETRTTPTNTKETGHALEIDHDRDDSPSRDRFQGYYREFKDQRHGRRSKHYYKDRYSKDNLRNSDKKQN